MEFGFEQIDNINNIDDWKDALNTFFEQKDEWAEVENYIKETTNEKQNEHENTVIDKSVQNCAYHEVDFQYRLLEKDFEKAHKASNEILKLLSGNKLYSGYRAW